MARANGQGTLLKRGKYFTAKWMVKGKIYTRSTKCTSKREAEKKLAEFVKPFQEKTEIAVLENIKAKLNLEEQQLQSTANEKEKPVMLKFLVDCFLNDLETTKPTDSTMMQYNTRIDAFVDFIGTAKKFVYEITAKDAMNFLEALKKKVTPETYNNYLATLRMMFNKAKKRDYRIKVNVWESFNKLKVDKAQKRRELTDDEVKKLCEAADKFKKFDGEVGLLFTLGAYTGLRISDCCSLKWTDIDFKKKLIKVLPQKTGKNGKYAIVPLHEKLEARLNNFKKTSEYVLPKLHDENASMIAKEVFDSIGIETSHVDENGKKHIITGFHALRHWFISNCIRQGIQVNVVQKMVAHSSASMSLAYSHVQESDLQLPDFNDDTAKVRLKKSTVEALEKAKGILDLDEFLMKLLEGKPAGTAHAKMKRDAELDKALDEMFAGKE